MNDRKSMRVSVVIPTYNYARFLPDAIDSVLGQTHAAFEIIVVDDGSSDNTREVLSRYGPRVRVISQTNRGLAAARNHGATESTGELIAFLDADDRWLQTKLEQQLTALELAPTAALVHCAMREVDATLTPVRDRTDGMSGWVAQDLLLMRPVVAAPSTYVVRRDVFIAIGGFDEQMRHSEDWDFCFRLAKGWPIVFVPEVLAEYRLHGGNMHRNVRAMEEAMLYAYAKAFSAPDAQAFAAIRRKAYGKLHLVLAGSFFAARDWLPFFRHAVGALLHTPSTVARFAAYPWRRMRRRPAHNSSHV